jgi:hypothetical protein
MGNDANPLSNQWEYIRRRILPYQPHPLRAGSALASFGYRVRHAS